MQEEEVRVFDQACVDVDIRFFRSSSIGTDIFIDNSDRAKQGRATKEARLLRR